MNGNDAVGTNSFNTGLNWTGGAAPAAGNTYQTAAFLLRTPANATSLAFVGNSLEVQTNGNLRDKTTATITINNLILDGGGIVDLSGSVSTLAGNLNLSGGMAYISAGGSQTLTVSSLISGSGGFYTYNAVSTGAGTDLLTTVNTFTGGIIVNAGTLQVNTSGGGTGLGGGNVTVNSGGTLIGGAQDAFGYSPNVAPTNFLIAGGTVTDLGTASYRITLPNLTFTGGTLTSVAGNNGDANGNYSLFGAGAPSTVTTLSNNTTAVISAGKISLQQNNQATGTTTFNIAAGNVTGGATPGVDLLISSPIADYNPRVAGVTKTGPGVMALSGTNTFSGGVNISAGTLQLGATNDTTALNSLLGTGAVTNNAMLSFASSKTITVSNLISGTGAVAVNRGAAVLSAANTYGGATTVASGGTLIVNNSAGSATGTGNVTVNSGGVLQGGGTIAGNVTVSGKTLPGVVATTSTVGGNLAYTSGAEADFYLSANAAGNGNDQIVMSGASSVLNCGSASVGIYLTAASLDEANDYVLFNLTGGSASVTGSFIATPVWLGATPLDASSFGIVNVGSKVVLHFSASGTTNLPVVANDAASGVSFTASTLNGHLISSGGQYPTVKFYYGPDDGGTNPAAWTTNVSLGLQGGSFAATASNLTANTTYYFAAAASNSAGTAWATPSQSFTTLALIPATVTNLSASNVQGTSATLNGRIISIGNQTPTVTVYYGPADGGTNAADWAGNIYLGSQSGNFAIAATGLATNSAYYFTAAAVNNAGTVWARPSASFTTLPTANAVSVLTYHNNNARTGANTNETLLTPANVNTNSFGRLFTNNVDGYIFAQPLYVPNLSIPGQGTHNAVFVATANNSVYAFDADGNAGANGGVLWSTNLGVAAVSPSPEYGARYHPGVGNTDISPSEGIIGTPVIDPDTGTIYFDVFTREVVLGVSTNYIHRLHALNLTNGMERSFSPVVVAATFPGTGVDSVNGVVTFSAIQHMARPAMTLAGGVLFVCFGSHADTNPYHGWVMGYDPATLQQLTNYVFNTTPNATTAVFGGNAAEGAIWMSGDGLCVDANTNLYFEVANGSFDANTGGGNYADSFIKFAPTNLASPFAVADYFTPSNQAGLQSSDQDLGSGGALLLPDEVGSAAHPHLLVGSAKTRQLYLLDRDDMGKYNGPSGTNRIVQEFLSGTGGSCYSTPAYFNYTLYYAYAKGNPMYAYAITNGHITTTPLSKSAASFNGFGTTPSVSANGTSNGIVWVIDPSTTQNNGNGPAVLRAYNATNLTTELYDSSQLGNQPTSRDFPGYAVKYAVPTVANGKVYVGTEFTLAVYGSTAFVATPVIVPNGGTYANSVMVSISEATPGAAIYYTLDGSVPTTGSTLYTGPIVITNTVNLEAIAVKAGAANSGVAVASFVNTAAAGNGTGLRGQYWTNTAAASFTNALFNTAATLTRTDAVVNFNWTGSGPTASIGSSNYTVRWSGSMQAQYDESYTFTTVADDGVRLWVNGQLVINDWNTHAAAATNSVMIPLKAQQLYNVRLEYFQGTGSAVAQLLWSSVSTAPAIIPQTQLYPYTNPPPVVLLTSPSGGATNYTGAASVTVAADADAPYNPVVAVGFYANGNWLGTLSNNIYGPFHAVLTATGLAAGNYTLTAVATDGSGLSNTSAPVNLTVTAGSGQPYGLTTNAPVAAFLNMPTTSLGALPPLLSGTGAFGNTTNRTPANGLIPYAPNTPLWSDAAVKSRYLAAPNNGGLHTPGQQITFAPTNSWTFPAGTVFVKNFDLVVNETNASMRRLETRLLVRDINGAVYGVTYKWRPDNSDADLLSGSLSEDILITNATGVRTQTWYYPSPQDCLTCHTPVANYVLGLSTRQLNGNQTYPATGNTDNQLRTLNRLGLFNPAFDEAGIPGYKKLSALTNLSASLEERSRSYLDANCAQCHQPGGSGITFDARYDTPLAQQHLTNYPAAVSLGLDNACIIKAKDIWRSVIYARMNSVDPNVKMPPLARSLVDTNALLVLGDWINSLPGIPALAPPVITPNGGLFGPNVSVTLTPPDGSAQLYYTLNGTLPATNSYLYTGPVLLTNSATFTASAYESNYNNSIAVSALFTVQPAPYFTGGSFLLDGQFQLGIAGVPGKTYVLQASTNLVNWIPLSTNTATTNQFNLADPNAPTFPRRFYRTIEQ